MGIDDLIRALQKNPTLEVSSETLLPFVDGPEFFEEFLQHKGLPNHFKARFYEKEGNLLGVIRQRKSFFESFIHSRYSNLDEIKDDVGVAHSLGVSFVKSAIAKALVDEGIMTAEIPDHHKISRILIGISYYIDPNIVGEEQAFNNIKKYTQQKYSTIDDIKQDLGLANYFKVSKFAIPPLAKACIDSGILSADLPNNHPLSKGRRRSLFFVPEVVGEEKVLENLKKYAQSKYKTLDDVKPSDELFADILGCNRDNSAMTKICVEKGILSPEMPDGHPISRGGSHLSFYLVSNIVGEEWFLKNLQKYAHNNFPTLDHISKRSWALGSAIGVPNGKIPIAQALVEKGIMDPKMPENQALGNKVYSSLYLNPRVVGENWALMNLKNYIQSHYSTLDDLPKTKVLGTCLGVNGSFRAETARACIEKGIFNPEMPKDHPISSGAKGTSFYLRPTVVGEEWALINLRNYIQSNYKTLDDLPSGGALENVLDIHDKVKKNIARYCIEKGILSPKMPEGHRMSTKAYTSLYLMPEVVGEEWAFENLKNYITSEFSTLDDLTNKKALTICLGGTRPSKTDSAKLCVQRGIMSPEMPDGHKLCSDVRSLYVVPEVVGEEWVLRNAKKYVQSTYSSLREVEGNPVLADVLGLGYTYDVHLLKAKIVELGWLDSDNFRSYVDSNLPNEFRRQRIEKKDTSEKHTEKGIGSRIRRKIDGPATFLKGEALEQLVGLVLSYISLDDLVIPQYCLDVGINKGKGYFKSRVDFKVGDRVYEIKWGNATENIEETFTKQQRLLAKESNSHLSYTLIRLDDREIINVPYQSFQNILDNQLDPNFKSLIEILAVMLMEASEKRDSSFLSHFRDFAYNLLDKANSMLGDVRRTYIYEQLIKLSEVAHKGTSKMEEFMDENIDRYFANLEAHFEWNGTLYRGFIQTKDHQKENPDRYEREYYFEPLKFSRKLDRDIAVLLEFSDVLCNSPARGRVDKILDNPKKLQRNPLFRLANGLNISTDGQSGTTKVGSILELKELLCIPNDLYNFALKEYIGTLGQRC